LYLHPSIHLNGVELIRNLDNFNFLKDKTRNKKKAEYIPVFT
jgi:hypothetical protein